MVKFDPSQNQNPVIVPALNIVVGPDGRLECRPAAGWLQPATHPHFVDVSDKTTETVVHVGWHGNMQSKTKHRADRGKVGHFVIVARTPVSSSRKLFA